MSPFYKKILHIETRADYPIFNKREENAGSSLRRALRSSCHRLIRITRVLCNYESALSLFFDDFSLNENRWIS